MRAALVDALPPAQKQRCSVLPAPNAGFDRQLRPWVRGGRGYYRYVGAAQRGDNIEAFQIGNDSLGKSCGGHTDSDRNARGRLAGRSLTM